MIEQSEEDCRVLVVQNGARHNYAVPLALATSGMLTEFYTDACGNQGPGKWAAKLTLLPWVGPVLSLLQNRRVPDLVLSATRSFPIASAVDHLRSRHVSSQLSSRLLGLLMALAGMGDAKMIYSSMGWSPWFLKLARKRGLRIVTEFFVRPSLWRVHQAEHRKFPGWESKMPYEHLLKSESARRGPCDTSDYILAPDQAVKDDLVQEGLFPADKIHVVPYGIGQDFFELQNQPVTGRVLFVGSCTIIKGIHYFAEASQEVMRQAADITPQFTAAGEVTELVRQQPVCSHLKFLGRVPRREVNHLYEDADVLVFPTLSDAFGMVILEAMATGVPVICSPYCADVVEDGVSGFVVEPRDTKALSDAILKIIQDRPLRERMSQAAKERARQFTWEQHRHTLANTLRAIHALPA